MPQFEGSDFNQRRTLDVLRRLDDSLEGLPRKIRLYSIGGTVLLLSGLKLSKDLDFILSRQDFRIISERVAQFELKEKLRIDLFPDGELPLYVYPHYAIHAQKTGERLKNIELYRIDDAGLLLTKAIAGREQDVIDLLDMGITPHKVPREEIERRFKTIRPDKGKEDEVRSKFEQFIERFYKTT